jgi:hypothetical protein
MQSQTLLCIARHPLTGGHAKPNRTTGPSQLQLKTSLKRQPQMNHIRYNTVLCNHYAAVALQPSEDSNNAVKHGVDSTAKGPLPDVLLVALFDDLPPAFFAAPIAVLFWSLLIAALFGRLRPVSSHVNRDPFRPLAARFPTPQSGCPNSSLFGPFAARFPTPQKRTFSVPCGPFPDAPIASLFRPLTARFRLFTDVASRQKGRAG